MRINLSAGISSLGYGQVGVNLLAALEKEGAEVALWPIGHAEWEPRHEDAVRRAMARQSSYDYSAPSLRVWHQFDLAQHVGCGLHAGFPIFELDRFKPNELCHLHGQDRLFGTSAWACSVLEAHKLSARKVPLGIDPDVFAPVPLPDEGPTVFLCVGKWELRKGHDLAIEAFSKAFRPDDDVLLVMHCHNPCFRDAVAGKAYADSWESYCHSSPMAGRIRYTRERLPLQEDVASLMSRAHCGVFLSRAEGWNLEATEMLAMGRHCIMSDATAHTEFATAENSLLVEPGPLVPAHDGVWFRSDDPAWEGNPGKWPSMGQKQMEAAALMMRRVHEDRLSGKLRLNDAGVESMKRFTWAETARAVMENLR